MFQYKTKGTCSSQIDLEIENGVITACVIHNGCRGNTSCPDQLAKAIEAYQQQA